MKVIRNRKELVKEANSLTKPLQNSVEIDIKTIEEYYETTSEEYGPLVIIINDGEQNLMEEKYPIIKELEPEDYITIYEDEKVSIERTCYILTDAGFIVYIIKEK